jgi:hypothetical protein
LQPLVGRDRILSVDPQQLLAEKVITNYNNDILRKFELEGGENASPEAGSKIQHLAV